MSKVTLIPQDKSNACWLAGSSMMESWKTGKTSSLADTLKVLDASGTKFSDFYNADKGLSFTQNQLIAKTLGLTALPPASYTIEYLTSILNAGPIMAVIMFSSNSNIAHFVVITGITGNGSPEGTSLQINDPLPIGSGKTYTIAFNDFLSKFEQVVAYENKFPKADLTSQLYYFADAKSTSTSNSSSNQSTSAAGDNTSADDTSNQSSDTADDTSKNTSDNPDSTSSDTTSNDTTTAQDDTQATATDDASATSSDTSSTDDAATTNDDSTTASDPSSTASTDSSSTTATDDSPTATDDSAATSTDDSAGGSQDTSGDSTPAASDDTGSDAPAN